MHEEEIKIRYKTAETEALARAFVKSQKLEAEAELMKAQSTHIQDRIVETVRERFKNKLEVNSDLANSQISEMSKQWRIMSASMVQVKRTVLLPGFHTKLNLCANSRYGIKEHKRYSGWSPFGFYNLEHELAKEETFAFQSDKLLFNRAYDNEQGVLDFISLQAIPQLSGERIRLLTQLTRETVGMIHSWRTFYNGHDKDMINKIKMMESIERGYNIRDETAYLGCLKELDRLIQFKEHLQKDLEAHANSNIPTIEKWKESNKNFLVLNELANQTLNI